MLWALYGSTMAPARADLIPHVSGSYGPTLGLVWVIWAASRWETMALASIYAEPDVGYAEPHLGEWASDGTSMGLE